MKDRTHLSIRMNNELHDKFKYVSAYEGRSMSKQVLYLLNIKASQLRGIRDALHTTYDELLAEAEKR